MLAKIIVIVLFISSCALAQTREEGEIYLSSDKVLKGYVKFATMYFGIQLKKPKVFYWDQPKGGKRTVYRATEVDSVVIPSASTFYSYFIEDSKKKDFFKVLYKDNVSLVGKTQIIADTPTNIGGSSDEYWILRNDSQQVYPLHQTTSWGRGLRSYAKEYLKDCPSLVEKISNKELRLSDIFEIIKYYNNCIN